MQFVGCKSTKMSSVTSDFGEKHTCKFCGYQTLKKTHLKLHEQVVHGGQKFQCPECEYQAAKKSILISHQKSVHMSKKIKCPECEH